jgi:hypothetical protein
VNTEHTGLRDLHFSARHRQYGPTLVAYDSDMNEYDLDDNLVAKLEMKHGNTVLLDLGERQFRCGCKEANMLGVPYYCVVYYYYHSYGKYPQLLHAQEHFPISHVQYYVVPLNPKAQEHVAEAQEMTEEQFVKLLYHLRGDEMPPNLKLFNTLMDTCCPPEVK